MKKIVLAYLLLICTWTANAQYAKNAFNYPYMYVGANAGLNYFMGESALTLQTANLLSGISYSGRISIGYNFSNILGFRGLLGFNDHNYPDDRKSFAITHFTSETVSADLMLNLSNLINYKLKSPFYLSVFVGGGMAYLPYNNKYSNLALLSRVGLQADFKLSPNVYLNLIGEANVAQDQYNDYVAGKPVDVFPLIAVGISYYITRVKAAK
jgi:hypothetical protein